ncbi:mannosyl-oligosaccharide alpha-1,2-mannosidase isoform A [Gorgonomyces haynaldii]|nr:mannosyl-oligosaccharide alpha-1,2-mannosidase isoform A [Gorgonomyces haynaldii]
MISKKLYRYIRLAILVIIVYLTVTIVFKKDLTSISHSQIPSVDYTALKKPARPQEVQPTEKQTNQKAEAIPLDKFLKQNKTQQKPITHQKTPTKIDNAQTKRQEKVKEMILHAWEGYMQYAKGYDELDSQRKSGYNWLSTSLLLTPIDAYDTLMIMGLKKQAQQAKQLLLKNLNFDVDIKISVFEVTIRVLGGLLSAYEQDGDMRWIELAKDLGNRLLKAFKTPYGLPVDELHLQTGAVEPNSRGMLAQAGSLQLEFEYLSDITNDPTYKTAAMHVWEVLHGMDRPVKGILPIYFDIDTSRFNSPYEYGISAGADSYYEYLLKYWLSTGDKKSKKWYDQFLLDLKMLVRYSNDGKRAWTTTPGQTESTFHHLGCFSGGMLALGAYYTNRTHWNTSTEFQLGQKITDTCYESYTQSSTGLGGERVEGETGRPLVESYALRPETVESLFYLWRLTKDQKYREWGWNIVQSLETNCRDEAGYHPLSHTPNVQMSFFLAETLKYLYLLFSDDSTLPLDKFVFNTEGHLFSRKGFGRRTGRKSY